MIEPNKIMIGILVPIALIFVGLFVLVLFVVTSFEKEDTSHISVRNDSRESIVVGIVMDTSINEIVNGIYNGTIIESYSEGNPRNTPEIEGAEELACNEKDCSLTILVINQRVLYSEFEEVLNHPIKSFYEIGNKPLFKSVLQKMMSKKQIYSDIIHYRKNDKQENRYIVVDSMIR